jgi:multidrug efflux pump subunit AcrB
MQNNGVFQLLFCEAILGAAPLIIGTGTGLELRQTLGALIIGGLF